jgi:hypothetical protein
MGARRGRFLRARVSARVLVGVHFIAGLGSWFWLGFHFTLGCVWCSVVDVDVGLRRVVEDSSDISFPYFSFG